MSATTLLAVAAMVQTVLLAWIAAWQARAAKEVRKANGSLVELVERSDARAEHVERLFDAGERDVDTKRSVH